MTHICVGNLTNIDSDNGLSPGRLQAIIWTNAGLLLIGPLGTNFNEILIEILTFSLKKMRLKVSSAKRRPFCLGLNKSMQLSCVVLWTKNVHLEFQRTFRVSIIMHCESIKNVCVFNIYLLASCSICDWLLDNTLSSKSILITICIIFVNNVYSKV